MRIFAACMLMYCMFGQSIWAHDFKGGVCDDISIAGMVENCLAQDEVHNQNISEWVITLEQHQELGSFVQANVQSLNHIRCGGTEGHISLHIVCSDVAKLMYVEGACRFADHGKFARFNFKFDQKRRKKYDGTVMNDGASLAVTDEVLISKIVAQLMNAKSIEVQLHPFPWLPILARFKPISDHPSKDRIREVCAN